jgi:two-component system response regulator
MNKKTILFIEDNKDDFLVSIRALKESKIFLNYLIVAYDGIEAKKYLMLDKKSDFKKMEFYPSLVILDLGLPYVGGIEILKKIKKNDYIKNIPVVVFTSSDNEEDLLKCYQFGVNSFVKKPDNYEEFTNVVRKIIDYWLEVNLTILK